jgi:hypothetical protein
MAFIVDKTRLNLSSVTTSDPSNHSIPSKIFKTSHSSFRSSSRIPTNSPRATSSSSIVKHLSPIPGLCVPPNLSMCHLQEIQSFHQKKIKEYKDTLESCLNSSLPVIFTQSPYIISKREKLKAYNRKIAKKRKEILIKKEEDEIKRLKQSHSLKLTSMYFNLAKNHEKQKKNKIIKEKIEKNKADKEKKQLEEVNKNIFIENIRNFYNDRINELKEKIKQEKLVNDMIRSEQKKLLSAAEKQKKQEKKSNSLSSIIF